MSFIIACEGNGNETKPLFDKLFRYILPDHKIIWTNTPNCHLIIKGTTIRPRINILKYKKPYIIWSGESFNAPEKLYPPLCYLSAIIVDKKNFFHLPQFTWFFYYHPDLYPHVHNYSTNRRPKFVACCLRLQGLERSKRHQMFDALSAYIPVDNLRQNPTAGKNWLDKKLYSVYSNYNFVICFENKKSPGYVTEKLVTAHAGGSIPIYWGDAQFVKNIFNPKRIIFVDDFSSYKECAKFVNDLYMDKIRLENMLREPVFNTLPPYFDFNSSYWVPIIKILKNI